MQFRGNSDRLQLLIEKIQANKENTPSQQQEEGETSASETSSETVDSDVRYSFGVTDTTPYQCQFCERAFPRLSYLKKHEQSHSELMPFRCDFCSRLFKHKRSRDRHIKLHTGDKKYRCSQCVAAFSRSDHLKIHMKTHDNQKPYQCAYCNRGYNTAAALTSHLQNHKREITSLSTNSDNSSSASKLRCPHCSLAFVNTEEYTFHMANKHNNVSERSSKVSTFSNSPCSEFVCKVCQKENFSTLEELQVHVQTAHDCAIGSNETKQDFPQGSNFLGEGLSCPVCNVPVSSSKLLNAHIAISHGSNHATEFNLSCKKCLISFSNSRSMIEHWLYFHGTSSPINDMSSDQIKPTDLSMVRKLKDEEQPNKKKTRMKESDTTVTTQENIQYDPGTLLCNQCNAAMPDFESFRTHLKSHLEESSSKSGMSKLRFGMCSYCRVPVSSLQEMVKHIATHVLSTVTEYSCNICQKIFSSIGELDQHLMEVHSHHLFLCYACKEVFDTSFGIQRHFKIKHANETKKFICKICPSFPPFPSEIDFELHIRNFHCGFDPFLSFQNVSLQCAYCNENCKSRTELENHMKLHCQTSLNFGKHKCNICDEICHSPSTLAEHKLTHCKVIYGSTCSHCKASITTEENFLSHMINHNNGLSSKAYQLTLPVSCVICRQTLVSESETRLHAKFHLQIEANKCNMCLQVFNKNDMNDNVCLNCLEGRNSPKQCPQCDFSSVTATELEAHISEEHKKMLKCSKCQAYFSSKDEYDLHIEVCSSTGTIDELKCNICLLVLPSQPKLQAHLIEHTFAGCANYTCYICSSVFTVSSGLQRHISEHGSSLKPYACTKCKMKFFFRAELDNHLYLHQKTPKSLSWAKRPESNDQNQRSQSLSENLQSSLGDNNNNHNPNLIEEKLIKSDREIEQTTEPAPSEGKSY